MILRTPLERRELLARTVTVAIVGASANTLRPSYTVFSYLRRQAGLAVTPINPNADSIDGTRTFPTLAAYAAERGAPDVVDVFRRPSELVPVVREAVAVGAPAIWFQYGVVNDEAIALADDAGMLVVVDRCIKVEHARFCGGLATAGMNTGVVTSRWRRSV